VTQGVLPVAIGLAFAPLRGLTGATRARFPTTETATTAAWLSERRVHMRRLRFRHGRRSFIENSGLVT